MFNLLLDSASSFKKDRGQVYESLVSLADQLESSWKELSPLELPESYRRVNRIIVAGMGGSALGGRVVKSLYQSSLKASLEIVTDYHLPAYIDEHTLIILNSYSGTTEETLSCAKDIPASTPVFVVATGGDLAALADEKGWPAYIYHPASNPSGMPRMAIGYNIASTLAILAKCHLISVADSDVRSAVALIRRHLTVFGRDLPQKQNPAKQIAASTLGKGLALVTARHLEGAVYVFKNQLNENSKTFSCLFTVPELNHHLLEGLLFPHELKDRLHFLLFDSPLFEPAMRTRMKLTADVILKQGYKYTHVEAESSTPFEQVWETISFGEYVSYYIAIQNRLDPGPIPWVAYFKDQLKHASS